MLGNITLGIDQAVQSAQGINPLDNQGVQNRVEQIQVKNVLEAIKDTKSVSDVLSKIGVDEKADELVRSEINNIITTVSKSNKKIADMIAVDGTTIVTDAEFGKFMDILEVENPDSFNKIVSGMTKLSKGYSGDTLDNQAQVDDIKSAFGKSSINIDSGIAAVRGTDPNTISFVNTMEQALKEITAPAYIAQNGKDKSLVELKKLDDLYATVYNNMPVTSGIERAFALSSLNRAELIKTMLEANIPEAEIRATLPNLLQSMERGLVYRGFRPEEDTAPNTLTSKIQ